MTGIGHAHGEDAQREKFTPKGSDEALPELDADLTDEDITEAVALFNSIFIEYVGLLDAVPVGEDTTEVVEAVEDEDWEWRYEEKVFVHLETGLTVDDAKRHEEHMRLLDTVILQNDFHETELEKEEITIQEWMDLIWGSLKSAAIASYLFGRGGRNVLSADDIEWLKELLRTILDELIAFVEDIVEGLLSNAERRRRRKMRDEQATYPYERANAMSWRIELPQYPGDGSQFCLSNCRCHWRIEDPGDEFEFVNAYWESLRDDGTCPTCYENSEVWFPYEAEKIYESE